MPVPPTFTSHAQSSGPACWRSVPRRSQTAPFALVVLDQYMAPGRIPVKGLFPAARIPALKIISSSLVGSRHCSRPKILNAAALLIASFQFRYPIGLASLVHVSPVCISVTVPLSLSTNLWAWASPDMTSPVRQSIKAKVAVVKSVLLKMFMRNLRGWILLIFSINQHYLCHTDNPLDIRVLR